jgi:hypothetical protein
MGTAAANKGGLHPLFQPVGGVCTLFADFKCLKPLSMLIFQAEGAVSNVSLRFCTYSELILLEKKDLSLHATVEVEVLSFEGRYTFSRLT